MTVLSETKKNQYNCNGAQVVFPYTFLIFDAAHLLVVHRDAAGAETVLTLTTDYTVSGVGEPSGGDVTTVATYASGETLTIVRDVPETQTADYIENDIFPAEVHEQALDKVTMMVQQLSEQVERALRVSVVDVSPDIEIPNAILRANRLLGFDANGDVDITVAIPNFIHNEMTGLQGGDTDEYYHLNVHEEAQISASVSTAITLGVAADTFLSLDSVADEALIKVANVTEFKVDTGGIQLKTGGVSVNEIQDSLTGDLTGSSTDDQLATAKLIFDHLDHAILSNLQGGTTGEYYHLTAFEEGLIAATAGSVTIGDASNNMVINTAGDRITFDADSIICVDLNADLDVYTFGELTSCGMIITGTGNKVELFSGVLTEFTINASGMTLKAGTSVNEIIDSGTEIDITSTDNQLATAKAVYDFVDQYEHNSLASLQGGDTGEFYHMNAHEDLLISATTDTLLSLGVAACKVEIDSTNNRVRMGDIQNTDCYFMVDMDSANILGVSDGEITLNAADDMFLKIGGTTKLRLDTSGLLLQDSAISSNDGDKVFQFGRAQVGYMGTADIAAFGHRDAFTTTSYGFCQAASGTINLNAPTGQNINFRINAALLAELNVANGLNLQTGVVINSADEDLVFKFGRAYVGYVGSADAAGFGHRDFISTTNVGFMQWSAGGVDVNAASGEIIALRNGGSLIGRIGDDTAQLWIDQSGAAAAKPVVRLDQADIDDSFIDFQGTTAADGTRSISLDTTQDSTKYGAIRIEINGVTKWIRIYDDHS